MKRGFFFAALLCLAAAITSCVREDDLEMLRHPIHVQGEIDPNWGVPVAYGEVNLNDLITMLSSDYTGYLDTGNIITVVYEDSMRDSVQSNNSKRRRPTGPRFAGRKDATWYTKDTTIRLNDIELDFFNNSEISSLMDSTQLALRNLWFKFKLGLWGDCSQNVNQYVRAGFDSLRIFYENRDGEVIDFEPAHHVAIAVNGLNDTATYRDSLDLASVINSTPRKISGSMRMRLQISSEMISHAISQMSLDEIMDSLNVWFNMTKLVYSCDSRTEIPLIMSIGNLPYSFDVDMSDSSSSLNIDSMLATIDSGISVEVQDSRFRMAVENNMPFDIILSATMLDANGNPVRDSHGQVAEDLLHATTIHAAQVRAMGATGNYESASPSRDTLVVTLNDERLKQFKDAKKLRMKLKMVTPLEPGNASQHCFVAIKRDNFLKLKASIQVHPKVNFDMQVTDGGVF